MKKVITYGTFDLFHQGHFNLLKQAKELGDYLIVGITSDYFDKCRGKYNIHDSVMTRIDNVRKTGLADEIIIEEYFGQKIDDIKKYNIDIFTVGSDWIGYFDYLNEYCNVVYSNRTDGISSTKIRQQSSLNLGIIGGERIVDRFISELSFVSNINLVGLFSNSEIRCNVNNFPLYNDLNVLLSQVDAVYINVPLVHRYTYIKQALQMGKHVLTEFPFCRHFNEAQELLTLSKEKNLTLMEGLKTAYCPAFTKMISLVKSGVIGQVVSVDARFTQILADKLKEQIEIAGGSVESLAAYPLLVIFKLLGIHYQEIKFTSKLYSSVDIFTRIDFLYDDAIASATIAIDAKSEGNLVVTGTKGYLYVPAPWWKTEFFELRYEDLNKNNKYFYKFEGEGLRYELVEFVRTIHSASSQNILLTHDEMLAESKIIDLYLNNYNITTF